MLISQLMLLPLLIFCVWIFYLISPKPSTQNLTLYNLAICVLAAGLCIAALWYIAQSESGANDNIWHPVLAAVSSYMIFPAVLFFGGVLRLFLFSSDT